MDIMHERVDGRGGGRIVWTSQSGRGHDFIFVLLPGGQAARGDGRFVGEPRDGNSAEFGHGQSLGPGASGADHGDA